MRFLVVIFQYTFNNKTIKQYYDNITFFLLLSISCEILKWSHVNQYFQCFKTFKIKTSAVHYTWLCVSFFLCSQFLFAAVFSTYFSPARKKSWRRVIYDKISKKRCDFKILIWSFHDTVLYKMKLQYYDTLAISYWIYFLVKSWKKVVFSSMFNVSTYFDLKLLIIWLNITN